MSKFKIGDNVIDTCQPKFGAGTVMQAYTSPFNGDQQLIVHWTNGSTSCGFSSSLKLINKPLEAAPEWESLWELSDEKA